MADVKINGARLRCLEAGRGDPVVMVHGSASDHRTWTDQQAEFQKYYRAIRYSRRYHWPNEPIPEGADYSMAEHRDDLGRLLRRLEAAPAHLVGHSYGGLLCLLLAIREPHMVRTLVLAEPPAITLFVSNTPRPWEILKLLLTRPRTAVAILEFGARGVAPATKAFRRGEPETAVQTFADAIFGRGGLRRLPQTHRQQVSDNLSNIQAELLGSGFLPLDDDRIRALRKPVLLVNGGRSKPLFHRLADRLEELLPQSDRIEIPNASHLIHEENAPAFASAVLDFLRRH